MAPGALLLATGRGLGARRTLALAVGVHHLHVPPHPAHGNELLVADCAEEVLLVEVVVFGLPAKITRKKEQKLISLI